MVAQDRQARGACRDEDPELFFPVGNSGPALTQTAEAKAICADCPVRAECLAWALESGQDAGVWGGMSEDERRRERRRQVKPVPTRPLHNGRTKVTPALRSEILRMLDGGASLAEVERQTGVRWPAVRLIRNKARAVA